MLVLPKYVYFIFILETSGKNGVCYENKNVKGKVVTEKTCCNNYFQSLGGSCLECPIGFHGKNCNFKCTSPFYGRLCRSKCNCERCHYIYGCDVKTTAYRFSLSSEPRKSTLQETQSVISEEITINWDNDVSSIKYEREPKDSVATLKQVIIITAVSSACTTVFLIIFIICTLITNRFLCKKQRVGRSVISSEAISAGGETNDQPPAFQEQSVVIQRNAIPGSQYETIDELNMVENSNIRISTGESAERNTHISSSSSDSKTTNASGVASEDTEGYVHPYNTLEINWQNKGYQCSSCINKTNKRDKS